jgi:hypothetical protein
MLTRFSIRVVSALAVIVVPVVFGGGAPHAQSNDIFIYPAKGQSQEKQDRDRYECHVWATKQTGFDPTRPSTASASTIPASEQPQSPQQPHIIRGGARGAALGAVGGAIAGDAGKGAAAGAAMGGLAGGFRRRDEKRQQASQQQASAQQVQNNQQGQQQAYHRAMAACLEGRGYTVK